MSWLRLDDGFAQHPKIVAMSPRDRWTWLELLCYCARYRTAGEVPASIGDIVRGASPAFLARCVDLELLEPAGTDTSTRTTTTYHVHDWNEYNPARFDDVDDAVADFLHSHPDASGNDVCKAIGGSRNVVLASVRRYRTGINPVPNPGTKNGTDTGIARAFPSRPQEPVPKAAAALEHQDAAAAHLLDKLDALGLGPDLLQEHGSSPQLVTAWLDLAQHEAKRNPAAFVLAGVRSGRLPSPRARVVPPVEELEPAERRSRFVATSGWRFTTEDLADELVVMGAEGVELVELLERADVLRKQAAHA